MWVSTTSEKSALWPTLCCEAVAQVRLGGSASPREWPGAFDCICMHLVFDATAARTNRAWSFHSIITYTPLLSALMATIRSKRMITPLSYLLLPHLHSKMTLAAASAPCGAQTAPPLAPRQAHQQSR